MLSQTEIISRIESDPFFALGFAVDNNPNGVIVALADKGFVIPNNLTSEAERKNWALLTLKNLLATNKPLCIDIISGVMYNKDATNYTAGFFDYFRNTQAPNTVTASQKFDLNALLGGLGAGLSTYSTISTVNSGSPQTAISQADADAAAKAEAEAKKRKTNIIIISVVAGVIVITVLVFVFKKKKQ